MNAVAVWQAVVMTNDRQVLKLEEPGYARASDIPLSAKGASLRPIGLRTAPAPLSSRFLRHLSPVPISSCRRRMSLTAETALSSRNQVTLLWL